VFHFGDTQEAIEKLAVENEKEKLTDIIGLIDNEIRAVEFESEQEKRQLLDDQDEKGFTTTSSESYDEDEMPSPIKTDNSVPQTTTNMSNKPELGSPGQVSEESQRALQFFETQKQATKPPRNDSRKSSVPTISMLGFQEEIKAGIQNKMRRIKQKRLSMQNSTRKLSMSTRSRREGQRNMSVL